MWKSEGFCSPNKKLTPAFSGGTHPEISGCVCAYVSLSLCASSNQRHQKLNQRHLSAFPKLFPVFGEGKRLSNLHRHRRQMRSGRNGAGKEKKGRAEKRWLSDKHTKANLPLDSEAWSRGKINGSKCSSEMFSIIKLPHNILSRR